MNDESIRQRLLSRGCERFERLLQSNGGVYSVSELAKLLNLSAPEILEMASARKLISFEVANEWVFPTAQFKGGLLIAGVREILSAFREDVDDVTVVLFFLSSYESTGLAPLALLEEDFPVDSLIRSASTLYQHGTK